MDAVDIQLQAYLIVCAGVGALSGSVGFPAFVGSGFFVPSLYLLGAGLFLFGLFVFDHARRQ